MEGREYSIEIENNVIKYRVVKSGRKTIGITIDINGEVKISAPMRAGRKQIEEVIRRKSNWIINKINEAKERKLNIVHRKLASGEKYPYLGKEYTLKAIERNQNNAKVLLQDDTIELYIPKGLSEENRRLIMKDALLKWYKKSFAEIASERIEIYSSLLKAAPCKIAIRDQKTRWGSCSTKGNINLNWRLVMAPITIIDYVIVHELCHLKFMNHSRDFWNLVESVFPNYSESRDWLKANGYKLMEALT